MSNLIEDFGKVTQFIETLDEGELVCLWKTVNTPEYIGLIADQLQRDVKAELDESMADTNEVLVVEEVIEEISNDVQ